LEQVVTQNADAIIVAADSYATQLLTHGVLQNRVHTVPFYVEDEFFQQPVKPDPNENFTFCYIGGFQPYHILLPIIEAFKHLHESNSRIELCLVGEGPLRSDVENEVSKRELTKKVRFLGNLPHSSVPNLLSKVDSLIVPTTYGISTNLLEAAAAGKAIITLKRRGDLTLEHYFRQGKEILYVEGTSPDEIAEAMRLVLDDPEVRNTLSFGARKIAKQYFNEQACLIQLQTLMQKIGNPAPSQFRSQINHTSVSK
jgi:glycosyltransferase involved in cell wall biosynthesis